MSGFAERFIQQGEAKGRQEGRQEEGAIILTQLLTLKFGPVSDAVHQRLQGADPDTLRRWSVRVLTASSLEEVFVDAQNLSAG